jgi:thioredoxin 1
MLTLHAASPDDHQRILREHATVLVDYYKDQCSGCRMLDMSLAHVAATPEAAGVVLLKVRMETVGEAFFRERGLRQTPTLDIVRNGEETQRLAGYQPPDRILAALAQAARSA